MSKIVDEIEKNLKNEKIYLICGYVNEPNGLNFEIEVCDIHKGGSIEQSFKDFIIENDYWNDASKLKTYATKKEKLKEYKIEEIKYYVDDLLDLFHIERGDYNKINSINVLAQLLRENEVKAYRLIDANINSGTVCDYRYYKDALDGAIRCYETQKERFIISCYMYD